MVCAWELTAGDGGAHRVLPDGCIDLVWREREGLQVAGPSTAAFLAALPPGAEACGVRLRTGAAPPLLGVAAPALRDAHVPAADVWGDAARRLEERLAGAPGIRERSTLMVAWTGAVSRRAPWGDPLALAVVDALRADPGIPVTTLARRAAVGDRQLRRRVTAAVGYGPKRLGRVLRLQRALRLRDDDPSLGWADVAHRAGYADQSHLSEECRSLAGVRPTALRA